MKKQFINSLLAIGMIASLTACGGTSGTAETGVAEAEAFDDYARPVTVPEDEVSIIYLVSNMTDESNIRCENQVAIEAAHRGWDYQVINYEKEDNFREYFQNAINQQPTAIIIGITQSFESYQDLVASARDAGIGVYSNDNSIIDGVISNSTMDNSAAAAAIMDQVIADHGPELNYAVFELSSEVVTLRADTAKSYDSDQVHLLDAIDLASTGDLNTAGYTIAQTWMQQYGDELQFIFGSADTPAISAAEAIIQAGDTTGATTFVSGVDGGASTWSYIRNDTPLKYTYSQPFEYFSHITCQAIYDIQVAGLNPGDEGCIVTAAGENITDAVGIVTTIENCPQPGDSIHSVFDYYGEDQNDEEAWYNWTDGPGIYEVTE
ncbi:MAG: hypothetical protein Q4C82_05555 [Eubacteriales bacterium]|nr:hypothetical protein [Eubacteriales bacterium]